SFTFESFEELYAYYSQVGSLPNSGGQGNSLTVSGGEYSTIEYAIDLDIDRAFQRVSDLSQYTAEELRYTRRWVVRTLEGVSSEALLGLLRQGSIAPIDLLDNTYLYTLPMAFVGPVAPGMEAPPAVLTSSEMIDTLSAFSGAEYFYPL